MKTYLALLLAAFFTLPLAAAEKVQSPERKAQALALSKAMAAYVAQDMAVKGGFFLVWDAKTKQVFRLKPVTLDDGDHLHQIDAQLFLSWGEFEGANKEKVMLDVYFKWTPSGFVPEGPLSIYKFNGKKRYSWDETGEYLKRLK